MANNKFGAHAGTILESRFSKNQVITMLVSDASPLPPIQEATRRLHRLMAGETNRMQIYGPTHLHGPQSVKAPHHSRFTEPAASPSSTFAADELQISQEAQFTEQARGLPEIRQDRVADIRAQIASGTYESAEKLDAAVSRLLDEIA